MSAEKIEMKCPFCQKGDITVIHRPLSLLRRKGPYGGSRGGVLCSPEQHYVVEDRCSFCGKTRKEIQDNLGGKSEIDPEKLRKRLKDSGLPTVIETKVD